MLFLPSSSFLCLGRSRSSLEESFLATGYLWPSILNFFQLFSTLFQTFFLLPHSLTFSLWFEWPTCPLSAIKTAHKKAFIHSNKRGRERSNERGRERSNERERESLEWKEKRFSLTIFLPFPH